MDGASTGANEGETITDIQNYLASFNKEIQDGGSTQTTVNQTGTTESGETFFVTQTADVATTQVQVANFPEQFNGNTFYQPAAHFFQGSQAADSESTEGEPTEISVTIPAALANQVSQAATEELLQAVEAQSDESEQPTFVAMQPDVQQVVVTTSPGTAQVASGSRSQTIRMVMQSANSNETAVATTGAGTSSPTSGTRSSVSSTSGGTTIVTSDVQEISVNDEGTLQMMANLAEQAAQEASSGASGDGQVLLNSGNSYQTVTIVPSDSGPGEVSYVLIVSQPDDVKGGKEVGMDMSVYDFNEGEQQAQLTDGDDNGIGNSSGTGTGMASKSGSSARVVKITPKKSQTVSQAHMCNYCNYTSPKRYLLSRHMKSHSEERPHKCSVCERGFKTLASLQNHVNTHTGTRPHQCKECDSAFTTSGELVRHVRYKHTHEKPHRCTECDYASVELSKLKRHMRCHTGERPYQCPHCTYASPDTYKLKRHLRIHTGEKPYECDVCHARFTQSNSLKAHKLIHSAGNKPIFQCELCPTTCGRKTDLRIHVQKLHTSDKPLKCKRCGKSFPDRYTYKVHAKTHEGEKCFKCDLCPYASISQRHLESHTLIHTDQKPYRCDQCDQAFRQKQLLKRHKNLYHDPNYIPPTPKEKTHECGECGRAFRHKGNLIRHMAIHDPDATAQEKAAALRYGRRRKIMAGEMGDDDDEEYEDEEDDEDEMDELDTDGLEGHLTTADGHQVVVLEVIQLQGPEGEQQAVAVLAGDGMDMVEASTIDEVHNSTSSDIAETPKAERKMKRIHHREIHGNGESDMESSEIIHKVDDSDSPIVITASRGGRGKKKRTVVDLEENVDQNSTTILITTATPTKRSKKGSSNSMNMNVITSTPVTPKSRKNKKSEGSKLPILDEAELARREAEVTKRRQQQKKRDVEECFGFNDDDEDDGGDEDEDEEDAHHDAESAIQLLAAMQHDDDDDEESQD